MAVLCGKYVNRRYGPNAQSSDKWAAVKGDISTIGQNFVGGYFHILLYQNSKLLL
jgi:hypothetical protein